MKKRTLIIMFVVIAAALVGWVGCTTQQAAEPAAPAETAAPVEPAAPVEGGLGALNVVSAKWAGSAHANAASEAFNHWNETDPAEVPTSCAKCHASSGFLDYIGADGSEAMKVDAAGKIVDPITCATCHNDAADVLDKAVLPNGTELAGNGSNSICMTCHSGMGSSKAIAGTIADAGVDEDAPIEGAGLMGVHYLAAAAVQAGADGGMGFQYEGKTYVGAFKHAETVNSCLECHDPHSLHTRAVVGSDANLCSTCHSDVASYKDYKSISMSKADYDGDGASESIYEEIEGVKAVLVQAMSGYAKNKLEVGFGFEPAVYPYGFVDTDGDGKLSAEEAIFPNQFKGFSPRMLKAGYNLMFATKDPAAYVHNAEYVLQLMYDSIADLSALSGVSADALVRP